MEFWFFTRTVSYYQLLILYKARVENIVWNQNILPCCENPGLASSLGQEVLGSNPGLNTRLNTAEMLHKEWTD